MLEVSLHLRGFPFWSNISLVESFQSVSFAILLSSEQLCWIREMLITMHASDQFPNEKSFLDINFSAEDWVDICIPLTSCFIKLEFFFPINTQCLESWNVLKKMNMSYQCNQLDSSTASNVVFITNELAFRGEFSQEYKLWLLNITSKHKLNKAIYANEGRECWNPLLNTFHKHVFVYVLKMCVWDYSDWDVVNHQETFFFPPSQVCCGKIRRKHSILLLWKYIPVKRWSVLS